MDHLITEIIRRNGPWKNVDAVEYATLEWVNWFNNQRLLSSIGYISPAQYETDYYDNLNESGKVAWLKQTGLRWTRGDSLLLYI